MKSKVLNFNKTIIEGTMKHLAKTNIRPLTDDEAKLTIMLSTSCHEESSDIIFDTLVKKGAWILQAIEKRAEACLDVEIDKGALVFVYGVADRIGIAIMYIYYMQWWAKKNGVKKIDFRVVAERIFPLGVFTEESLRKAWDSQKRIMEPGETGSDNRIDYAEASQSIMLAS